MFIKCIGARVTYEVVYYGSRSIEQILTEQCENWTIHIEQKVNWTKVIISKIPQKLFEHVVNSTNKFYFYKWSTEQKSVE